MKIVTDKDFYNILVNIINNLIEKNKRKTELTVVFDIDGTLFDEKDETPIQSIYNFYRYCEIIGINNIIVTARSSIDLSKNHTLELLDKYNIKKTIYFMKPGVINIFNYKRNARKNIAEKGKNVIMSIGDNLCDIGEYGGLGVLVKKVDKDHISYHIY